MRQHFGVESFGGAGCELALAGIRYFRACEPFRDGMIWLVDKDIPTAATGHTAMGTAVAAAGAAEKAADVAEGVSGSYSKNSLHRTGVAITKNPRSTPHLKSVFPTVILVKDKVSHQRIHDAIQDILLKYGEWDDELKSILSESSDVQALIDAGTRLFRAPLLLHDNNFSTVAVSSEYANDRALAPLLDSEKLPFLMRSEKSRAARGTAGSNVIYFRANDMLGLSANLFRRGNFKYRLMLLECGAELHDRDAALLEHFSNYVRLSLGLVTGASSRALTLTGLVSSVLSGESYSNEYFEDQMAAFGWKPGDTYVIYRVFTDIQEKEDRSLGFLTGRIADIFDEQCVFELDGGVVAVFDLSRRSDGEASIDIAMSGFLRDNNMSAGRSDTFIGLGQILRYYTQAGIAYDLGPRVNRYKQLCKFREVVKEHLLESCTERLPAPMVCAPELLLLKAYDDEHQTEFYRTLSVFLKNDLHPVKTSKELFIARSTFIYRIEKIRSITGLDFNKISDHWYWLLSLELIERLDIQEVNWNGQ
ncbi:MAG: helix-turn-helix domain-containing protein [Clostridiales Family XIII bacterium]|nr:helix-turn-helix domain-containing protein [Clostridiales Family XIII bacterium]